MIKTSKSNPAPIPARFYAGLELCLLTLLFIVAIWGPAIWEVNYWSVGAGYAFFALIAASAVKRRQGWKDSGFRLDNFGPGIVRVGLVTLGALGLIVMLLKTIGISMVPVSGAKASGLLASGLIQQALLLGYLFHRWEALLGNGLRAALANGAWFGFVHLPDPGLMALAGIGGLFLNGLFIRVRNIFAIGLAHGVLSIFTVSILVETNIIHTTRIGPPALAPLSRVIMSELNYADRIGICSHVLAPDQFGQLFGRPIERIVPWMTDDGSIRPTLERFLISKERVFCVITEREFRRHVSPEAQRNSYILGHRYIWRAWENKPHFYDYDPLLGILRDRVLLISNRPSSRIHSG